MPTTEKVALKVKAYPHFEYYDKNSGMFLGWNYSESEMETFLSSKGYTQFQAAQKKVVVVPV